MRRNPLVFLAGSCVVLWLAGCSAGGSDKWKDARPKIVPAEGVVTYKGAPLPEATVVLAPMGGGRAASAVTDSEGRFVLAAFPPEPGAVPGSYQVMITKLEPDEAAGSPGVDETGTELPPPLKSVIPKKYSDPAKGGLTAEIPASGKTDILFELQGG